MKQIVIFSIIIFIYSCNIDNSITYRNIFTDINPLTDAHNYFLVEDNCVYMTGEDCDLLLDFNKAKTIILKSKKENLEHWDTLSYNIPGRCEGLCQTGENIYMVNQEYMKGSDPKYSIHSLYKISKQDGKFQKIHEWHKEEMMLRKIHFETDEIGYLVYNYYQGNISKIFYTNDASRTWRELEFNISVSVVQFTKEKIYLLNYEAGPKSSILIIDKNTKKTEFHRINIYADYFALDKNENILLLSETGNESVIYRLRKGVMEKVKTLSPNKRYLLEQIYAYNDFISVLCSKYENDYLFYSFDNGVTWHKRGISALYMRATTFYKDIEFYSSTGPEVVLFGRFMKKNL